MLSSFPRRIVPDTREALLKRIPESAEKVRRTELKHPQRHKIDAKVNEYRFHEDDKR